MHCMKTLAIPLLLIASTPAAATEAQVGQPAIDFSLPDLDGTATKLSDFRGKTVVLEWFNPGCPFVVYAHESGPLKSFAAEANKDDVVWLAINSSAPEKQGHGVVVNKQSATTWSMNHPILIDEDGKVGKAYGQSLHRRCSSWTKQACSCTPEHWIMPRVGVSQNLDL